MRLLFRVRWPSQFSPEFPYLGSQDGRLDEEKGACGIVRNQDRDLMPVGESLQWLAVGNTLNHQSEAETVNLLEISKPG